MGFSFPIYKYPEPLIWQNFHGKNLHKVGVLLGRSLKQPAHISAKLEVLQAGNSAVLCALLACRGLSGCGSGYEDSL